MRESVQYRSYRASATKPLSPCLKAGHKSRDQDQQSPLKINTLPRHDKLNSPYENKRHQRELEPESSMFETRDDPLDDPRDKLKHPRKNNRIATRRESAEMETKETTSMNNQSKSLVVAKFEDAPRHSRFRKWGSLGRRKTVAKKSKPDIQMGGLKNDDSTSKIENRKWGFLGRRKAKLSFCFFPKFFRRSRGNNNDLESQRLREVRISVGEQEKPESGKDGQESQTSTLQPGYQLDCAILGDQTGIEDLCSSSKEKQELDPHLLLQIKSMADAIAEQYHGLVSNAGSVQTDRALAGRQPQENKDQGGLLACHGQQTNMITSFYRDLTSCNITGFNKTSNTKMFDIPHDHLEKTNHGYVGFEDDLTELTWDCTIPSVKEDLNSLEKLRKLRSLLSKAETQSLEDQSVREAEASVREAEDKFAAYLQNIRLRGII